MSGKARVLVVEDEQRIRRFLHASLAGHEYEVIEAATGRAALEQAAAIRPDILLLDLGLPDMDGVEVIRRIRERSTLPIIVLSVRAHEQDKIAALDAGADDYLSKPFGVGELLARLRVALRHLTPSTGEPIFQTGELRVDLARRWVTVGDREIKLTPTQYAVLKLLVIHAGQVVTHQQLVRELRGVNFPNESHYVRVFVSQLRQKIESNPARPQYILSEPGVGYRLRVDEMNG
jgi:two-component system, OmpR family, KDP operon response regulator KdpE